MKNVQDWLDEKYSLESRESVEEVGDDGGNFLQKIFLKRSPSFQFTGNFNNFINFKSLTRLNLAFFQIGIESIESFPRTLESLVLSANSFPPSNLEPLRRFSNMRFLDIGYFDNANSNFHNKWYGSLEPLSDMDCFEELYIESTDIDSGLEYLSKEIKIVDCKSNFSNSKCLKLEKILNLINRDISLFCVDLYREEIQNKLIIQSIINDVSQGIKKEYLELKLKEFQPFFLKFIYDYEKEKSKSEELENENVRVSEEIKKILNLNNVLRGKIFDLKFELKKSEDSKNKISEALEKELMLLIKDKKNIDFEKPLS